MSPFTETSIVATALLTLFNGRHFRARARRLSMWCDRFICGVPLTLLRLSRTAQCRSRNEASGQTTNETSEQRKAENHSDGAASGPDMKLRPSGEHTGQQAREQASGYAVARIPLHHGAAVVCRWERQHDVP